MKINVKRIPEQGEHLQGAEPAAIMDLAEPDVQFTQEVAYDLFAQVQGHALLVTGKLRTPVALRCSRCLATFEKSLVVREFVVHRELAGEDFVDLTENIREDIILELPQRALCRADCCGLCPTCGKNLNEGACQCAPAHGDVRWHALEQLKLK
jgi:uncharacterized protein